MPALEAFPPASYGPVWVPLAIVAMTLVIVVPLGIWWFTRPQPPPPPPAPPPPPDPEQDRRETLAEIARIRQALADGSLAAKPASQRLSRVVRTYLADHGRSDLDAMTLHELRQDPRLASVADFVAGVYEPAFGPGGSSPQAAALELDRYAEQAERLVGTWR